MVSPNKNPQGFKVCTLSKTSFTIARSGMDRNIPGIPHKAAPAITASMETSALSFTLDPIILGTI